MNDEFSTMRNPFTQMHVNQDDPIHKMFLKRKSQQGDEPFDVTVIPHNEKDVRALEEFCKKFGIVSASFGNIPPAAALRMLKICR